MQEVNTMKKAVFMAALAVFLAGCAAEGDNNVSKFESSSASAETKAEDRIDDRFYVEDSGDGYVTYVSGDGRLKERLDYRWDGEDVKYRYSLTNCTDERLEIDNEHCTMSLSFNNSEKCFPIYINSDLAHDAFDAGETREQRSEKEMGCPLHIADADEVNVWNESGGNTLWLSAQGNVIIVDGDEQTKYSFPEFGSDDCFKFSIDVQ